MPSAKVLCDVHHEYREGEESQAIQTQESPFPSRAASCFAHHRE